MVALQTLDLPILVRIQAPQPSFAKATEWLAITAERGTMHYCYILLSSGSHIFYYGSTKNLKERVERHNNGEVKATKPHLPWKLAWYAGFSTEKEARDFERYLKTGSGKAFAYKRLVPATLKKDINYRRKAKSEDLINLRNAKKQEAKKDLGL